MKLYEQKIKMRGVIQGVGMRPAVCRVARRFGLTGSVVNRGDSVDIVWQGDAPALDRASASLSESIPPAALITEIRKTSRPISPESRADGFTVEHPVQPPALNLFALADRAPCARCLAELHEKDGRRYRYFFNSCGDCGPRATVITSLPYERSATAWKDFPPCDDCDAEYNSPDSRRFGIESVSCPSCGPVLRFLEQDGTESASGEDALLSAAKRLNAGGVIALKGVGGFQLLADCRSRAALERLRRIKKRPEQPLALLARDLAAAKRMTSMSPEEGTLLASPEAPILLLPWLDSEAGKTCNADLISPDAPDEAGFMLPASPLHHLLLQLTDSPLLVATSGNLSGFPPALDTEEAVAMLGPEVDGILTHGRAIHFRYDDSLAAMNHGRFQIWRRARGYAPAIFGDMKLNHSVLAMGAQEKNTFAAAGNIPEPWSYLSPHQGDMGHAEESVVCDRAIARILHLLPEKPMSVAVDLHPDYSSTLAGEKLAKRLQIPVVEVPHHYAHALAALAESGLEEAVALVMDGTGLGPDGALWGAELLYVSRSSGGRRLGTFRPVPLPGGELAIRHPLRQYFARAYDAGMDMDTLKKRFPEHALLAEEVCLQCKSGINTPMTHGAGRWFDAAAAWLGLADGSMSFEAQAPMRLEYVARREASGNETVLPFRFVRREDGLPMVDWRELWNVNPKGLASPARSLHMTFAEAAAGMIEAVHAKSSLHPVLLAGGVFQNRLFSAMLQDRLKSRGIAFFMPSKLPVNDGAIAAGQLVWAGLDFRPDGDGYRNRTEKE